MKTKSTLVSSLLLLAWAGGSLSATPLGTAFTYQGQLTDGGQPAEEIYDLRFAIYDSQSAGSAVAGPVTNSPVAMSNGLFAVTLDFGADVFTGEDRWLEIGVRTNGSPSDFTLLAPRQLLTPSPYALYAPNAGIATTIPAGGLTGTIAPANIANGSITGDMLAPGSVTTTTLADGAVGTGQLADGAVTAVKMNTVTTWFKMVTFFSPTRTAGGYFGDSVAAVGTDRVLIGASGDDTGASRAGVAYLFGADGTLLTTFTNPTPVLFDYFGISVAAVGTGRVLIGASGDDAGMTNVGAAYLFSTDGTLLTTFTNPTPAAVDAFGNSVAAVGTDRVLIGAWNDDTGATNAGAAYLFSTDGTLLTTFTNPAPAEGDSFGCSVAAVGSDRLLIGALGDDTGWKDSGAAYLFSTNGTLLTTFTNPTPSLFDYFGCSVAAVGTDRVLIGAKGDDSGSNRGGAAYLFSTNGTLLATFTNPTPDFSDYFGCAVAAVGADRVLIGNERDFAGTNDGGAAYLFSTNGTLLATLTNPTAGHGDYFGHSVAAVGGDRVLIGAYWNSTRAHSAGVAYLFGPEEFTPGLVADGVRAGSITTTSLADGAVTADKIGGVLSPDQIPDLDASKITSGTMSLARLPAAVVTNNESGVTLSGTFSGNGSGLTNLDFSQLTGGTVPDSLLSSNVALRSGGNVFTGNQVVQQNDGRVALVTPTRNDPGRMGIQFSNNMLGLFLGDDTQEQIFGFYSAFAKSRTNDARLLVHGKAANDWNAYLELTHDGTNGIVGTDAAALELRPGGSRALRLEPGTNGAPNVIAGSPTNSVSAGVVAATIAGGGASLYGTGFFGGGGGGAIPVPYVNRVSADFGTIGGGGENSVGSGSSGASVAGGFFNHVEPNAFVAAVGGGVNNVVSSNAYGAVIAGGWQNRVGTNAWLAAIGGGSNNVVEPGAYSSTISGGWLNSIGADADQSTISGGAANRIFASSGGATIGGGGQNEINQDAPASVISGGAANVVRSGASYSTIPGGYNNEVGGSYSLAAGHRAKALHSGSFVWADSQSGAFASTAINQFLVRASGGVGINKTDPATALDVAGTVSASSFLGGGGGLTGLSASNVTSGTLPDTRLSANVALRIGGNTFTGDQILQQNEGYLVLSTPAYNDPGRFTLKFANNNLAPITGDDTQDIEFGFYSAFAKARTYDAVLRVHGKAANSWNTYIELTHDGTDGRMSTDSGALVFAPSNRVALRLESNPFDAPNVVGGSSLNLVAADVLGATIAGGGGTNQYGICYTNAVLANFGTVGGGWGNRVGPRAWDATIAGGILNEIGSNSMASTIGGGELNYIGTNSLSATIAGGLNNEIGTNSDWSTIGGGTGNEVGPGGRFSTIPGGELNHIGTGATYAFAGGHRANASHSGTFVWADNSDGYFTSSGTNQFLIRASGGVGIGTNNPSALLDVAGTFRLGVGGTTISRIQTGTINVGTGSAGVNVRTNTFPTAFSSTPRVIVSARGADYNDTFIVSTRAVTTTGFKINVLRVDQSSSWAQNLQVDWIAWEE